ncbi:hypothetical protein SP19_142 [Salmonella phage 19]|nr:hypothetical protein SP19_142 [Salmonella phage 19]
MSAKIGDMNITFRGDNLYINGELDLPDLPSRCAGTSLMVIHGNVKDISTVALRCECLRHSGSMVTSRQLWLVMFM